MENTSRRYRTMLWFARIVPGIIAFEIVWDIFTRGWMEALELGGWFFGSAGAFVLAIESLWVLKPDKRYDGNNENGVKHNVETVRLGIFLLMVGFVLISVMKILERINFGS